MKVFAVVLFVWILKVIWYWSYVQWNNVVRKNITDITEWEIITYRKLKEIYVGAWGSVARLGTREMFIHEMRGPGGGGEGGAFSSARDQEGSFVVSPEAQIRYVESHGGWSRGHAS